MSVARRKYLNITEKVNLLNEIDLGVRKKDVAEKFNIPASTLSTILKNRDTILKAFDRGQVGKKVKVCLYDDVDKAVLRWLLNMKGAKVLGKKIRVKALDVARKLGHKDFSASPGWLEKFKKRHGFDGKVFSKKKIVSIS